MVGDWVGVWIIKLPAEISSLQGSAFKTIRQRASAQNQLSTMITESKFPDLQNVNERLKELKFITK